MQKIVHFRAKFSPPLYPPLLLTGLNFHDNCFANVALFCGQSLYATQDQYFPSRA